VATVALFAFVNELQLPYLRAGWCRRHAGSNDEQEAVL
jgi:hypothetical protein